MRRATSVTLDHLIDSEHTTKVGSDGFVRVVDYMGTDSSIVQAARVSYGEGTKKRREDRDLIRYLMRHWHTTPFEMCEIKFHVRVPMDIWRQWIRHRTASVNEYSTRYSLAIDSAAKAGVWRKQSTTNKQGSSTALFTKDEIERLNRSEQEAHTYMRRLYDDRIAMGVAREQARKDLPLSTYTEAYWKVDLHNLFHFLRLRLDKHAQQEIREFGQAIRNYVRQWVPVAFEAFEDYRLNSAHLSAAEMKLLRDLLAGFKPDEFDSECFAGMSQREQDEFTGKFWQ